MEILAQVPRSINCIPTAFDAEFRDIVAELQEKHPGCQVLLHTMTFTDKLYVYNMVFNIIAIHVGSAS